MKMIMIEMLMLMFMRVDLVGLLRIFIARRFGRTMAIADRRQIQNDERKESGDYYSRDPSAHGDLLVILGHCSSLCDFAGTVEKRLLVDVTWTCVPAEARAQSEEAS